MDLGFVKCKEVPRLESDKQDRFYSLAKLGREFYKGLLEFASDSATEYSNPAEHQSQTY